MIRKIFLLVFIFFSLLSYSQGTEKKSINWISLNKAENFAKKYNKNILIFFYRPGCEYCDKMKQETLNDTEITKIINENFLPVMINGRGKDTIIFNNKKYGNQQPADHGYTWRHDFFAELVKPVNNSYYWPDIVIINNKYEKLDQFSGFQPRQQLLRNLKKFIK